MGSETDGATIHAKALRTADLTTCGFLYFCQFLSQVEAFETMGKEAFFMQQKQNSVLGLDEPFSQVAYSIHVIQYDTKRTSSNSSINDTHSTHARFGYNVLHSRCWALVGLVLGALRRHPILGAVGGVTAFGGQHKVYAVPFQLPAAAAATALPQRWTSHANNGREE